jgi:hypothetical protein
MPIYSIDTPKQLTREEFESLRGTSLHEAMFRNRVRVRVEGISSDQSSAFKNIEEWLKDRAGSHFYIEPTVGDGGFIFFEDQAEMVALTLTFNGEDVVLGEVETDVGRPVPPHVSGPMPVLTGKRKFQKPWELPDALPEQVWKSTNLTQTRARYGEEMVQRAWKVLRRK